MIKFVNKLNKSECIKSYVVLWTPIDSIQDLIRNNSLGGVVSIYFRVPYYLNSPDIVLGNYGEYYIDTRSKLKYYRLFIGKLYYYNNKYLLKIKITAVDDEYSDVIITCDPRRIVNTLNNLYNIVYRKGSYSTTNSLMSKTNIIDMVGDI